jgi:hypothetical protein
MVGVWVRRGWALVRGVLCWIGAVALVAAGGLLPLILAGRVTFSAVYAALGAPRTDLSDIGLGLIALGAAAVAGLMAGVVGSMIACFPALALIGRSGVFDRVLKPLRRRREEAPTEDAWPF